MSATARERVSIVGAGPGDPELITVRALARIRTAEVLVYDRLVDPALVAEAPPAAERVFAGKARGFAALEQHEIEALLIARALAGKHVVRLKGGDPYVFGRGGEEVRRWSPRESRSRWCRVSPRHWRLRPAPASR